ncbi:hypothetical protein [Cryptosporangium aurantiacum]|uniref:Secreted protein n=1 Tax=Cryptosporangium aurantiacum TaxID=134849 RepID=A0A1M7RAH5_9ACTN|nr:hypothetical protein [Cryptosporangium aurantiacum]SHN43324.1 hypothetical protein SAMN05443668_109116 [Cryptosporangium aurantiacum]
MATLLEQLPALLGVLVGAAGSLAVATIGDRARFRRDQDSRSLERRLAAYRDYSRAMKSNVNTMLRVAAQIGEDPRPHPHPLAPEAGELLLAESVEARDLAWETLLLLGSAEVLEAASAWFGTVATLERSARDATRDPVAWDESVNRQFDARMEFYAAARRDLGLQPVHQPARPLEG